MQTLEIIYTPTIEELLSVQDWSTREERSNLLRISGVDDVYNPTALLCYQGQPTMLARKESRDREIDTETLFFQWDGETWAPAPALPVLPLQDPFITHIDGRWIVGGVHVEVSPDSPTGLAWETHLYSGATLDNLEVCFKGPEMMKDIRLVQLADGRIGVFTRPQGQKGGRGQIGFTTVDRIGNLTKELLEDAPIIPGLCTDEEWCGANDAHLLEDGRIGVLGHIARYAPDGTKQYYAMTFIFDSRTGRVSQQQIIASSACFPDTEPKREDLKDIVFPGGIINILGKRAIIFCGVSDTHAGVLELPDPFH